MKQPRIKEQGVALVTTVIVVAVLAVVAVAFMQTTTVDRLSSRSVANYTRAKLVADAGLAVATAALATNTTNDTFIVVLNTNRQLFVGNGVGNSPGSTDFVYVPLFSTVGSITSPVAAITTGGVPATNVAGGVLLTNQLPGGLSITSPPVSWVYLTDAQGATNGRFAYWVEDLGGKLDLSTVGTNTSSPDARRPTGTNPAEIALWAALNNSAVSAPQSNQAGNDLVAARSNIITAATAVLVDTNTRSILAELTANVRQDTNEPMLIPFGFGYTNQGEPKFNLNTNTNAAAVANLASIINRNLGGGAQSFGTRGGGLSAADYVNNIAANIVDFIDADATPTVGTGYRGVEAMPFLNERMTRFVLAGPPVNAGRNRWEIKIETTEYFEFWNLHSRTSPATTINFSFTNRQPLNYSGRTNFNIVTNYSLSIPAMPPGSYFVTNALTITNTFSVTSFASPSTNPICTLIGDTRTVEYTVSAGSVLYDRGSGSHYSDKQFSPGDLVYFSASYPGLGSKANIAGIADSDFLNSVGDPRASFYMVEGGIPRPQIQPSWVNGNTSFGGRTLQSGMSTDRLTKEVRMQNWGDSGHSGAAGSRGSGNTPPATGLFHITESDFAPASANRNTNGRINRATDLSAIFDPLQWGEANQSAAWPNEPGAWTNLTSAATNSTAYGGGHTLRIGRPEFTRFTNNGTRAAQLLDLLAVSPVTNTIATPPLLVDTVPGRININTAGTNALRALAAGVFQTNDPRVTSGSGNGSQFVVPVAAVDGFVTGVTNFRAQRPFYSASQLPLITTNGNAAQWPTNAVFGNRALLGITAGNDDVTEEWFSRVYPLATVRSRNFLVHVVAQALQTNGTTVLSTARKAFQVYVEPDRPPRPRNVAGRTTNSIVRVLGTWDL